MKDYLSSEEGQERLQGIEDGLLALKAAAAVVAVAAPPVAPVAAPVGWLAGIAAAAVGALGEMGRRSHRNKKALVSIVRGLDVAKADLIEAETSPFMATLGAHQDTAGTRKYIRAVRKKVNGG